MRLAAQVGQNSLADSECHPPLLQFTSALGGVTVHDYLFAGCHSPPSLPPPCE